MEETRAYAAYRKKKIQEKRLGRVKAAMVFCLAVLSFRLLPGSHLMAVKSGQLLQLAAITQISPSAAYGKENNPGEKIIQEMESQVIDTVLKVFPIISYSQAEDSAKTKNGADPVYSSYVVLKLEEDKDSFTDGNEAGKAENGQSGDTVQENNSADSTQAESQSSDTVDNMTDNAQTPDTAVGAVTALAPVANEITGVQYSIEQLSDFNFLRDTLYYVHSSTTVTPEQLNAPELLSRDMTIQKNKETPQILIFHTHAYEAFADSAEGDNTRNIVAVGDYLTQLLTEQYGFSVIHDSTLYPYNDAYSDALAHVTEILEQNPTIEVIIDLHRDAANAGTKYVTEINGKPTAKIMFFNGMCQTVDGPLDYVSNPYLQDNLALTLKMKLAAEAYYPDFTRKTFLKAYRYNQHLRPRSMLIEAGTNTNTFDEVRNAMEPLADLLNKVLSGE